MRALIVLIVTCVVFAQTGAPVSDFGLKGDILGETLEDFRTRNARDARVSDAAEGTISLHYPVCSGEAIIGKYGIDLNFATFVLNTENPPDKSRYRVCVTGQAIPGGGEAAPTIAGIETRNLLYRFVDGKLFEISAMVGREDFGIVAAAFREKYGDPSLSKVEQFQNGFGAKFEGVAQQWRAGNSVIDLR